MSRGLAAAAAAVIIGTTATAAIVVTAQRRRAAQAQAQALALPAATVWPAYAPVVSTTTTPTPAAPAPSFTSGFTSALNAVASAVAPVAYAPAPTGRPFLNPLADARYRKSSPFGPRINPVTGQPQSLHNGLDMAAPSGTPIYAAAAGRVTKVFNDSTNGHGVKLDHDNGMGTAYIHMVEAPPVRVGQTVARGQLIGRVGSTGRSTGPHLHFMVYRGSTPVDPETLVDFTPWSAGGARLA